MVAGCSDLSGTGEKGYITGEGQITTVPAAERGEPVELQGKDLAGDPLSLSRESDSAVPVHISGARSPDSSYRPVASRSTLCEWRARS